MSRLILPTTGASTRELSLSRSAVWSPAFVGVPLLLSTSSTRSGHRDLKAEHGTSAVVAGKAKCAKVSIPSRTSIARQEWVSIWLRAERAGEDGRHIVLIRLASSISLSLPDVPPKSPLLCGTRERIEFLKRIELSHGLQCTYLRIGKHHGLNATRGATWGAGITRPLFRPQSSVNQSCGECRQGAGNSSALRRLVWIGLIRRAGVG